MTRRTKQPDRLTRMVVLENWRIKTELVLLTEQRRFLAALESDTFDFIAIYNHRRVGKTFLVRETNSKRVDNIHAEASCLTFIILGTIG